MTARWALLVGLTAGVLLSLAGLAQSETKEDKEARANAKARMEAARKVYNGMLLRWRMGPPGEVSTSDVLEKGALWSRRWMEAQIEASTKKADQIAAAEEHLARMRKMEKIATDQHKNKALASYEVSVAEFHRLDAEKRLRKLKNK
jgi:hypothetical protein